MTDLEKSNLLFFSAEAAEDEDKKKEAPSGFLTAELARKLAVEVVGTYALTLTATASGSPVAIGFVLSALIYAFGHISGGHFNPAVTFAALVRGAVDVDVRTFFAYSLAQITGAFIGGAQHNFALTDQGLTFGDGNFPAVATNASTGAAFLSELTATLLFTTVILNVATTKAQAGNQFFGIAIGFVLIAAASSIGNVSGGCLNPAIGLALPLLADKTDDIWIYVVAPLLGGALGAGFFRLTADPDEFKEKEE
jgi:aquaporin Z